MPAMDIVDQAALLIEARREAAIASFVGALCVPGAAACIGCGEDIEASRRTALPSARRCIECQDRVERRDRQRGKVGG